MQGTYTKDEMRRHIKTKLDGLDAVVALEMFSCSRTGLRQGEGFVTFETTDIATSAFHALRAIGEADPPFRVHECPLKWAKRCVCVCLYVVLLFAFINNLYYALFLQN